MPIKTNGFKNRRVLMGKSRSNPPEPAPEPAPVTDPEVRRLLRRAVHGLKKPIKQALESAKALEDPNSLVLTVHLGLPYWSRWICDAEIALGDSE